MEQKRNTIFYNSPNPFTDEDKANYKKNKNDFYRIKVKLTYEDDIELIQNIPRLEHAIFIQPNYDAKNIDAVDKHEFYKIIDYNNEENYYGNSYHGVIVCRKDEKDKVIQLIKDAVDGIFIRNYDNLSSIRVHAEDKKRGVWKSDDNERVKYPINILSFKRANDKNGTTHLTLCRSKLHHYIFVEPSQEEEYRNWINSEYCRIIVLPSNFSEKGMGSTSVRNYILDFWKGKFDRVWMLDDNIWKYKRIYQGVKNEIEGHGIFSSVEKYIERYDNVGICSHNFNPFIIENEAQPCVVRNGKSYSSLLISTDNDIRFRYKHQEDNLISMEYITKGYCNLCFNHILYDKQTSGMNTGGNHETIYKCTDTLHKKGKDVLDSNNGSGYKERYEYFECIVKILYWENKLKLKKGADINKLVTRSTQMKTKEYHAKCNYTLLEGHDTNTIVKKHNYNEILDKQKESHFNFIDRV